MYLLQQTWTKTVQQAHFVTVLSFYESQSSDYTEYGSGALYVNIHLFLQ